MPTLDVSELNIVLGILGTDCDETRIGHDVF